jgi:hypothetical protein
MKIERSEKNKLTLDASDSHPLFRVELEVFTQLLEKYGWHSVFDYLMDIDLYQETSRKVWHEIEEVIDDRNLLHS